MTQDEFNSTEENISPLKLSVTVPTTKIYYLDLY